MLTGEEFQVYMAAPQAQKRALWRLFVRRKQAKQRLLEYKAGACTRPGLDEALEGTDEEARDLMEFFKL